VSALLKDAGAWRLTPQHLPFEVEKGNGLFMIGAVAERVANWKWRRRFVKAHPEVSGAYGDFRRLRLILGVGRSGTTWLARVLAETPTPIRFFMEGLYHVRPRFRFSASGDHTAIRYLPVLSTRHPLLMGYGALLAQRPDWEKLGVVEHLRRDDPGWQACLVKEVHSLLATEGLLRAVTCPTVFVLRDAVYVVDSLFTRDGIGSPYLCPEREWVCCPDFLERFASAHEDRILWVFREAEKNGRARETIIIEKALVVSLIQQMFRVLASECSTVLLLEYEDLCRSPEDLFRRAASFLTLDWGPGVRRFLAATTHHTEDHVDTDPVFRDTSSQPGRPFHFLTPYEADLCRRVLQDCGLDGHDDP